MPLLLKTSPVLTSVSFEARLWTGVALAFLAAVAFLYTNNHSQSKLDARQKSFENTIPELLSRNNIAHQINQPSRVQRSTWSDKDIMEDTASHPESFPSASLKWPNLKFITPESIGDQWTSLKVPEELQELPEDEEIPYELSNILKWSLQRPEAPKSAERDPNESSPQRKYPKTPSELSAESDGRSFNTCDGAILTVSISNATSSLRTQNPSVSLERRPSCFEQVKKPGNLLASDVDFFDTRTSKPDKDEQECTSCFDDIPAKGITKLSCSHAYCKTCISTMIATAMQVEANFPPKCCLTEIPLLSIILALDPKQREEYMEKAKEFAIPTGSRWYCPSPSCSKWIPPSKLQRLRATNQICPYCSTKVCSVCRGFAHDKNNDCQQDFGLDASLEIAESEGWQRCFSCRTMVELSEGCHHITCKCGAQFCYVCGKKWKTCPCNQTDEVGRLVQLREQRTMRDAAVEAEAEEIARAIAEIEEFERQEETSRHVYEAQKAEERRIEEEELARLEQERLRKEEEKRMLMEDVERQRITAMRLSVEERRGFIQEALEKIVQFQLRVLTSRHEASERKLAENFKLENSRRTSDAERMSASIVTNVGKRTMTLQERHKAELKALERANEDVFVNVQIFLPGTLSREEQEKRASEEFMSSFKKQVEKVQQEREKILTDERTRLEVRHKSESRALERNAQFEKNVVMSSNESKQADAVRRNESDMKNREFGIWCDRRWFEAVTERRRKMLELHFVQMLKGVETGEDTDGLTLEAAKRVLPLPKVEMPVQSDHGKEVVVSEKRGSRNSGIAMSTTPEGSPSMGGKALVAPLPSTSVSHDDVIGEQSGVQRPAALYVLPPFLTERQSVELVGDLHANPWEEEVRCSWMAGWSQSREGSAEAGSLIAQRALVPGPLVVPNKTSMASPISPEKMMANPKSKAWRVMGQQPAPDQVSSAPLRSTPCLLSATPLQVSPTALIKPSCPVVLETRSEEGSRWSFSTIRARKRKNGENGGKYSEAEIRQKLKGMVGDAL